MSTDNNTDKNKEVEAENKNTETQTAPNTEVQNEKESEITQGTECPASEKNYETESQKALEIFNKEKTEVLKDANADYIETVNSMNKSLSDFTADTQVQAAAFSAISELPFDKLIGGPLCAAIAAQSDAANSTLKFIQAAGLKEDKAVMVSFDFIKDGKLRKFQIPLLTLVPIPTFSIKSLDYEFKVKVEAGSSAVASTSASLSNTWNAGYNSPASNASGNVQKKASENKEEQAAPGRENIDAVTAPNEGAPNSGAQSDGASQDGESKGKTKGKSEVQSAEAVQGEVKKANEEANKAKEEERAAKRAETNTQAAKASEQAATTKPVGYSMNASISTKKDSSATRTSRYSVEATMDVRIKAGQDDLPAGVLTMLEVLNSAYSTFDPNGELTIMPQSGEVELGSNGKAQVLAKYLNEDGIFAPSKISCSDANTDILDEVQTRITFDKAGVFVITAGKQSVSVNVKPAPKTEQPFKSEN